MDQSSDTGRKYYIKITKVEGDERVSYNYQGKRELGLQ
jgi:hypothetical protein